MDNETKKKVFLKPEAEIVDFADEDIITFSNGGDAPNSWTGEPW